jgi:hypothetical protein
MGGMAEVRTLTTLCNKREEILHSLYGYQKLVAQSEADLAHINAIIRVFEATGDPKELPRYTSIYRLFRRHEKTRLCLEALEKGGELSTREIAAYFMTAKGFDTADKVLLIAITQKLVQTLRVLAMQGKVAMAGKRRGMCVWATPIAKTKNPTGHP